MSGEFEELVHDSMEWFAADVRVPAGLAGQARRQHRRRRLAARAVIAAGTAAAAAATVIVVAGSASDAPPRPAGGGAGRPQEAAYIIGRAEQAITDNTLIMQIFTPRQVVAERPYRKLVPTPVPRAIQWVYRRTSRTEIFAAYLRQHGQPHAADTDVAAGPPQPSKQYPAQFLQFTQTAVNHTARTWSRGPQLVGRGRSISPSQICAIMRSLAWPQTAGSIFSTSPSFISAALACGGLAVAGRAEMDGVDAIKLTGVRRLASLHLTMYVSPVTYLLLRVDADGLRQDYRWLTPTPANLALLQTPIPHGYRRVADASPPNPGI